jgi:type IV pilus assembly protein PilO
MANLRSARRNLFAIGTILLVVDIIAVVILLSPANAASAAKVDEFNQLRQQVQAKTRTVVPPDQVQQRVEESRKQIAQFIQQRIPSQASALSVELGRLAAESGVRLGSVHYAPMDSDVPGLLRYRISVSITGDYLQEVKFINALERARTFYVLNSVNLGEQSAGTARLALDLDTYLKELQ